MRLRSGPQQRNATNPAPRVCPWCKELMLRGALLHRFVGQDRYYCSEAHAALAMQAVREGRA